MMVFLVDIRVVTLSRLKDVTRHYIVQAKNRDECEDKIDRLVESFKVSSRDLVQVIRIKHTVLDKNGIGEL